MRITVLGKSPSWQDAGGACSGYLVQEDGFSLLLDCGNGVFSKLRRFRDYVDVDAVLISHLHADHFLDLVPFSYALTYAPRQQPVPVAGWPGTDTPARPRAVRADGRRRDCSVTSWLLGQRRPGRARVPLREYDGPDELSLGPFTVRFCEVPHYTPTFAVELSGRAAAGSPTAPTAAPTTSSSRSRAGTDLLLIEATLPRPERTGMRGHLTPAEAGDHGRRAGARRVVITHFSDELDPEWARAEASAAYGAPGRARARGRGVHVAAPDDGGTPSSVARGRPRGVRSPLSAAGTCDQRAP